ncbi:MAG: aminopeptidase P family protein [Phycisphaerales bacterium]|nr:aminopeptidase P family protein [Phycisphaerales bacterium]
MNIGDGIALAEFVQRRERVLRALGPSVGLVLAGDGAPPLSGRWLPDWNFYYLTGIRDEAGAAILFDPRAEDPKKRCTLLLRPLNPELEEWDGLRDRISEKLKKATGFQTVLRAGSLARLLTVAARKRKRVACLHPFSTYPAEVSPDLALFRRVVERTVGVAIEDRSTLLAEMRAIKSKAELAVMQRAVNASARGFGAAVRVIRPGITERDVQRAVEGGFAEGGADGPGYNSIVGSGLNGCVLHYMDNSCPCEDGDLVVIDAGARVGGYTADVTRTYPVSGRFTPEQRDVYTVVLRALAAATKAVRPGVHMSDVEAPARAIIEKAGYGDFFPHGIGHQLGIEVHDVTPDGPLKAGMVVTVEPGVYIQAKELGVRIEDDVLVTPRGGRSLTDAIPKDIADIEAAMRK